MRVAGANHELAFVACESAHRRDIGIDQSLEELAEDGLGRALFARDDEKRVGPLRSQRRQQPGEYQHEVVLDRQVEEATQSTERSATLGQRERQKAGRPAKAHWRLIDDPPTGGRDLNGAPTVIREIQVEAASVVCNAQVD
jgi:hypothetical protein